MFKLDDNLLRELGLGALPAAEKNRMLGHIYETLEMRVGMKLAQKMTNEQLDEFEAFIDRSDEAGALKWLETNFPDYKQVVADELERLKTEIKTAAPQILAASQEQAAAAPAPMSYGQQQPMQQPQQPYQPVPPQPQMPQQQPMPMNQQAPMPPTTNPDMYAPQMPQQPQPQQPPLPPDQQFPPAA